VSDIFMGHRANYLKRQEGHDEMSEMPV